MPAFTGTLNPNQIYGAIYNMIISQHVFSDNIKGTYGDLASRMRVDGSLYGDTKLYYSTDVLQSVPFVMDSEDQLNLLAIHRPKAPKVQAITINVFRQIRLTLDNYLTKQAWSTEGAFSEFNSVMMGWIRDTKRVYDSTTINVYAGITDSAEGKQHQEILLEEDAENPQDQEAVNRINGQRIAQKLADLIVELTDVSRDYNDYHHLRSYDPSDLLVIWNSEVRNKLTLVDIPTIFDNRGLRDMYDKIDHLSLPARYFGTINEAGGTASAANTTIRSLIETSYPDTEDSPVIDERGEVWVFPGDRLPNSTDYQPRTTYTQDDTVLFRIIHKRSLPYMSAFSVGTSFFNAKNLSENNYLTFGHNTLEYLKNYPWITVRAQ